MYVLDREQQRKLLLALKALQQFDAGGHERFVDPTTGQGWIRFWHHPESHGGGWPVLRTDPPPAGLELWLDVCLGTGTSEDIKGLAWELSQEPEAWSLVLDWLEANKERIGGDVMPLFLEHVEILPPRNRRSTDGKHITEIDRDYEHFRQLSDRAHRLLTSV